MELVEKHPILEFKHGRKVKFTFDGREMDGFEGEPIAAALHANGVKVLRYMPKKGRPKAFLCHREVLLLFYGRRWHAKRQDLHHAPT